MDLLLDKLTSSSPRSFSSLTSHPRLLLHPPVLKQSLRSLFKSYGEIVDVVAHTNLRMRGQAFVSFKDKDIAAKARKEVTGFPLYGKPMVSRTHPFTHLGSD